MERVTKTTCPYCGVGCGIVATRDSRNALSIAGDRDHPANFGRLCSKGAALAQTIDLKGRLLHPLINGEQASWDDAIHEVALGFRRVIDRHGPDAVAFYVSGQILTEDYYVANKLMKGFIGSANIDTNSRLCMSSSVAGHKRAFGSDTVPCCYEDLERSDMIVLTGSNTAWCHPVLFQRIKQAKKDNPHLYIAVIDPRRTATCEIADLHLPLAAGSDVMLFNGLLAYLHLQGEENKLFTASFTEGLHDALNVVLSPAFAIEKVAEACGLPPDQVEAFYKHFARTERVITVYSQGVNQSSSGTDKVNSIINCHLYTGRIGRPGMGPFSFTGQPNAMGGREVGGLANQLAAHMEIGDPRHRSLVQRFWRSPRIATEQGLKAVDLFDAIYAGKIKAVWIMGTNPVVSLPDATRVKDALARCGFVAVSDCVQHTDTTLYAHVLLPATTWGEKDGTVTNSERRISRQREFMAAPGEAKHDWWIIAQVAKAMGFGDGFNYQSPYDIFIEYARLSGFENHDERDFDISGLAALTQQQYDELTPVQWPVKTGDDRDTKLGKRFFADGRFYTPSGKARFVAVDPRQPVNAPTPLYPLVLNTGRLRDQWHTMTRTGKTARLTSHEPEPYVAIHPKDADKYQVQDDALTVVKSRWGEIIVKARVTEEQYPGSVFIPMHWNRQFASAAGVGEVINPALDPVSGQPEFKHTPVSIEPRKFAWRGFLLSRRSLPVPDASYWIKVNGDQFIRYELAGDSHSKDWAHWARQLLCQSDSNINWIEYFDGTGNYRGARLVGDKLESCVFISASGNLPSRQWLANLFTRDSISRQERAFLLSGKPPSETADIGHIVCACFGVGEKQIVHAIREKGCSSVEAIGATLKAGTNCGSCIPELQQLLQSQDKLLHSA
ncbi:MAG: molybdopterin-dependent oxidoreductase [Gammaproteobacteria bacterium]|nr:molybdopterin-dependent oxidoreductase [Gammaproteobacteria bacterium]